MSDREGLLDTSALLALHALRDTSDLPDVALISAVTLAELSVGPLVAADDACCPTARSRATPRLPRIRSVTPTGTFGPPRGAPT